MKPIPLLLAAALLALTPTHAASSLEAAGLASIAEGYVNTIVTFAHTRVFPAKGRDDAVSFTVIADKPLLGTPEAKKAWLLVAAGAIGNVLNEHPEIRSDEAWFSDIETAKQRRAIAIPCSVIKTEQQRVKSDQTDIDQFYAALMKAAVEKATAK